MEFSRRGRFKGQEHNNKPLSLRRDMMSLFCWLWPEHYKPYRSYHILVLCLKNLHCTLITAWGRGWSSWGGMLNSSHESVVLCIKFFRHGIHWVFSACANTPVGYAYTKSKPWPNPSDSFNISPSFTPSFLSSLSLCCHFSGVYLVILHTLFNTFSQEKEKKKCKASSFTKTINHFQVHGSSICRRSPLFFSFFFF